MSRGKRGRGGRGGSEVEGPGVAGHFDVANTLDGIFSRAAGNRNTTLPVCDSRGLLGDQFLIGQTWDDGQFQVQRSDPNPPPRRIDGTAAGALPPVKYLHLEI